MTPMLLIVSAALPEFVSVTLCAALVVPVICDAKVRLEGERVTAGAVPVPDSDTLCGLPAASSVTVTLPVRLPPLDGVNVTEIVQLPLTASVAGEIGHVFVCAKSAAFVPLTAMELIVSGAVPLFVSVVDWLVDVVPTATEPRARLVGLSVTAGLGFVPVPLSATDCGLPGALSVTETDAGRLPEAVGENVAEMEQFAPAASVDGLCGHVVLSE